MKRPNAARVGHLTARRRVQIYVTAGGVWLSGAVWVPLHYFFKSTDSYGFVQPNPGEHYTMIVHAAFAFLAVWLFGVLWPGHIKKSWRARVRRWSGGFLFGFIAWLAVTGYLLYYIGSDAWLNVASLAHWIAGLAAMIPFVIYLVTRTPRHTSGATAAITE